MLTYFDKCLQEKIDFNYEYRAINHKTGKVIYVKSMSRVFYREDGTPYKIFGTKQDITEIKITLNQLEESQKKYKSIIENMQEVYYRKDLDGNLLIMSDSAKNLFGYESIDELLKLNIKQLYKNPLDHEYFIDLLKKNKKVRNLEQKFLKKDGTEIIVLTSSQYVYDQEDNISGIEGVMLDFTDTKKLQEQLSQSQKLESIGQLASGVAHDFNNLLTVIIGYTELLVRKLDSDKSSVDMLEEIFSAGNKAQKLTNQLLAYSRKQFTNPKIIDLNFEIKNIQKMLRRLIREDIEIIYDLIPNDALVKMDSTQLNQIIFNLSVNAKDAMPKGGIIRISTREINIDDAFIKKYNFIKEKGTYIELSVMDTGTGMDQDIKEKIFEPFFTTKGIGQGTGLGLSMVYGVVKQHEGYILVDSEPGIGSTFKIYFLKENQTVPLQDSRYANPLSLENKNKTIMVVEDDDSVCKYIQKILKYGGYKTICFSDPKQAVAKYNEIAESVDLLLTDIIMPNFNGKELWEILNKMKPLKVIYVSGYPNDVLINTEINEKIANFLTKPIDSNLLLNMINDML